MNETQQLVVRYAAIAGLVGLITGAVGLLGQAFGVAIGGRESSTLVAAFSALSTTSVTALIGLAVAVWRVKGEGEGE